jgi:hypothetical protein
MFYRRSRSHQAVNPASLGSQLAANILFSSPSSFIINVVIIIITVVGRLPRRRSLERDQLLPLVWAVIGLFGPGLQYALPDVARIDQSPHSDCFVMLSQNRF